MSSFRVKVARDTTYNWFFDTLYVDTDLYNEVYTIYSGIVPTAKNIWECYSEIIRRCFSGFASTVLISEFSLSDDFMYIRYKGYYDYWEYDIVNNKHRAIEGIYV